jgi:hypothetical protein
MCRRHRAHLSRVMILGTVDSSGWPGHIASSSGAVQGARTTEKSCESVLLILPCVVVRRRRCPPAAHAGRATPLAPRQLRLAHAVLMAREGVPLVVIQRRLGHANLGITSVYQQGIDNAEIIDPSCPPRVHDPSQRRTSNDALTRRRFDVGAPSSWQRPTVRRGSSSSGSVSTGPDRTARPRKQCGSAVPAGGSRSWQR